MAGGNSFPEGIGDFEYSSNVRLAVLFQLRGKGITVDTQHLNI
jgi:hypothetical protein